MTAVDSSARDRAIEVVALALPSNARDKSSAALEAWAAVDALIARPEVLRALAGVAAPDAAAPDDENEAAAGRLFAAASRSGPTRVVEALRLAARELLHSRGAVGGGWARDASRAVLGVDTRPEEARRG